MICEVCGKTLLRWKAGDRPRCIVGTHPESPDAPFANQATEAAWKLARRLDGRPEILA